MEPPHLGQIRVGEDVAVQHEERSGYEIGGVADSPAGPERLVLDHVAEADAEVLGIAEGRAHVLHAVGARQDDVGDTVRPQQRELIREEGAIEERNHRLRPRQGQGAQARALAAGQDHGLQCPIGHYLGGDQGSASLISITGIPSRIG